MRKTQSKKLTFREKFSYGLGDCSANIIVALTGTFLSAYYTDTVGIAAVAVRNGFSDSRRFINAFRSLYGVTPLQYRKISKK